MIILFSDQLLILRSNLQQDVDGDFTSGTQVGNAVGNGAYRIGMTGAELEGLGCTHISVETLSGHSAGPFAITKLGGLDNTCTSCNCRGNDIGGGYFWAGGRGACYGSEHFGLMKESDIHVECGDDVDRDKKWGHFHRSGFNTGIYTFGNECINEVEGAETYSFYLSGCNGMYECRGYILIYILISNKKF